MLYCIVPILSTKPLVLRIKSIRLCFKVPATICVLEKTLPSGFLSLHTSNIFLSFINSFSTALDESFLYCIFTDTSSLPHHTLKSPTTMHSSTHMLPSFCKKDLLSFSSFGAYTFSSLTFLPMCSKVIPIILPSPSSSHLFTFTTNPLFTSIATPLQFTPHCLQTLLPTILSQSLSCIPHPNVSPVNI